jgi:hypothetical protein
VSPVIRSPYPDAVPSSAIATTFDNDISGWSYTFGTGTITNPSGVMSYRASSIANHSLSWASKGSIGDVEILAKVRQVGTRRPFGVTARVGGSSAARQGYALNIDRSTGSLELVRFSGSSVTSPTAPSAGNPPITTAFVPTVGTWYWFRFRLIAAGLVGKAWQDGQAEPGAWMVSSPDVTFAAGMVGLYDLWNTDTRECDYYAYSTDGSTIPLPT